MTEVQQAPTSAPSHRNQSQHDFSVLFGWLRDQFDRYAVQSAYMSEPLTWNLQPPPLHTTLVDSFDEYTNSTFRYLPAKYKNATLATSVVFTKDATANAFLLRYTVTLPSHGDTNCGKYMPQFPGSVISSCWFDNPEQAGLIARGVSDFVCNMVAQNTSTRLTMARL
ncbi:Aste57867_14114 [Aphanomyces stellatus]|uniref:Aste57867_14114 protein n=1 Tax=Aphanomyces stellatus TaxID=120398 RepID=A0A485L0E5_9STRA|nr:hypothetical protein As57867_014063 [Aphanomyces stellatus]VFT90941.1 Aste57867_14114 [Aphanomyces stellatus]